MHFDFVCQNDVRCAVRQNVTDVRAYFYLSVKYMTFGKLSVNILTFETFFTCPRAYIKYVTKDAHIREFSQRRIVIFCLIFVSKAFLFQFASIYLFSNVIFIVRQIFDRFCSSLSIVINERCGSLKLTRPPLISNVRKRTSLGLWSGSKFTSYTAAKFYRTSAFR